jgi:hypothetical protein
MIDFLGIKYGGKITPVRDLLMLGFDITYLPIPNNDASTTKFEPKARKRYNESVRASIAEGMRHRPFSNRRPLLLGVALPGTVNKQARDTDDTVIGQFNLGITDYTQLGLTLLTAVRMSLEKSRLFVDEELHDIYDLDSLNNAGNQLSKGLTKLDSKPYIYDAEGNIMVLEPS